MSGPATPAILRGVPCSSCGSTRSVRWQHDGRVYCVDQRACDHRAFRVFDDFAAEDSGDALYERWLETRYEEDPRDLEDEARDEGLQWLRSQSGR